MAFPTTLIPHHINWDEVLRNLPSEATALRVEVASQVLLFFLHGSDVFDFIQSDDSVSSGDFYLGLKWEVDKWTGVDSDKCELPGQWLVLTVNAAEVFERAKAWIAERNIPVPVKFTVYPPPPPPPLLPLP